MSPIFIVGEPLPDHSSVCGPLCRCQVAPALWILDVSSKEESNACSHMDPIGCAQQRGFGHQPPFSPDQFHLFPLSSSHPYTLPVGDIGSGTLWHGGDCCCGASLLADHPGMLLSALLGHACRTTMHQERLCDPDSPGSSSCPLFSSHGHEQLPDSWLPAQWRSGYSSHHHLQPWGVTYPSCLWLSVTGAAAKDTTGCTLEQSPQPKCVIINICLQS